MITYLRANKEEIQNCFDIRISVFVKEQGWTMDEEIDALEDTSIHYVALDNDKYIATLRLVPNKTEAHVGRVCVLKEYRNQHIGFNLMNFMIEDVKNKYKTLTLSARLDAIPFYTKFGFKPYGDEYMFGPTKHIEMIKYL